MVSVDLRLGDCLDILPTLTGIDAVVTDPPYGLDFRGAEWDSSIPLWIAEARRIAPVVVFTTAPTTLWDYPRPDWVSCWYRTAAQSRNIMGGFNHWTPIVVYGKPKFVVDTFYSNGMVTAHANKGIEHPSPKDVGLMRWMVINCTNPGDTVLDPFMGSGTTGVACVQTGRNFIGIEKEPEYYAIGEKRIKQAQMQPALFTG